MPPTKKTQKRAEMANMVRAFLLQAFHGDVDRTLAPHLYRVVNDLYPPASQADWTGDLAGSGYELDRTLTHEAQAALGPVYRVLKDDAGGRWLHDMRTITEFRRMGTPVEASAYVEAMRRRFPAMRAEVVESVAPKGPVRQLPTAAELVATPVPPDAVQVAYSQGYTEAMEKTAMDIAAAYEQGYAEALRTTQAGREEPEPTPRAGMIGETPLEAPAPTLQDAVAELGAIADQAARVVGTLTPAPTPLPATPPVPLVRVTLPEPADPLFGIEY